MDHSHTGGRLRFGLGLLNHHISKIISLSLVTNGVLGLLYPNGNAPDQGMVDM
jgi:hypothetical protein